MSNQEAVRVAAWKALDPERVRLLNRITAAQPERRTRKAAGTRAWRAANVKRDRERKRRSSTLRRARNVGLPATITAEEMAETLAYFHGCCAYCLRPLDTVHWDHMVAVVRGGGSTQENMVPACPPCNLTKSAKPIWAMATAL